jgi:hypothetical protein
MFTRAIAFLSLSGLWLLESQPGHAQAPAPSEYRIKAAFIFNFAKFVEWPVEALPADNSPFVIGILGENPFGSDLEQTVAGKKINDHPITIRPFLTAGQATNCHILFISSSEQKRFTEIIQGLRGSAVLTVAETDGFVAAGGMVNFLQEANKIRFQINDGAANAARLKISSKLLSLAVPAAR